MACCWKKNQLHHWPSRHIKGCVAVRRAIDGGAQMVSSFAAITVKNYVTFAMDCCDREALDWAASTGGYDSDTVRRCHAEVCRTSLWGFVAGITGGVAD